MQSSRKVTVGELPPLGSGGATNVLTFYINKVSGNNTTAVPGDASKPYLTEAAVFDSLALRTVGEAMVTLHYLGCDYGTSDSRMSNYNITLRGYKMETAVSSLSLLNVNWSDSSKTLIVDMPYSVIAGSSTPMNLFYFNIRIRSWTAVNKINSTSTFDFRCTNLNMNAGSSLFLNSAVNEGASKIDIRTLIMVAGVNYVIGTSTDAAITIKTWTVTSGTTSLIPGSSANNCSLKLQAITGTGAVRINDNRATLNYVDLDMLTVAGTITSIYLFWQIVNNITVPVVTGRITTVVPLYISTQYQPAPDTTIIFKNFIGRLEYVNNIAYNFIMINSTIHTATQLFQVDTDNYLRLYGHNTILQDTPAALITNQSNALVLEDYGTFTTNATSLGTNVSIVKYGDNKAKRIVATGVSGTYDLNLFLASDFKLTLTGATILNPINLPKGTETKEYTIMIKGNFGLTVPLYWVLRGDVYDGLRWNFFTVQVHNGNSGTEEATVFLSNLY